MKALTALTLGLTVAAGTILSGGAAEAQDNYRASCGRTGTAGTITLTQNGNPISWRAVGLVATWGQEISGTGTINFPDSNTAWSVVSFKDASGDWIEPTFDASCYPVRDGVAQGVPQAGQRLIAPMVDDVTFGAVIPRAWDQQAGIQVHVSGGQLTLTMPSVLDSGALSGAGNSRPAQFLPDGGPNGLYNGTDIGQPVIVVEDGRTIPMTQSGQQFTAAVPVGLVFNIAFRSVEDPSIFAGWTPVDYTEYTGNQPQIFSGNGPSGMPWGVRY